MIRINLLGEKEDNTILYLLQFCSFCLVLAFVVVILFALHQSDVIALDKLKSDSKMLTLRLKTLSQQTKDATDIENKKKELRIVLQTIAQLKSKKHGPVHILDEVSNAIPEKVWLTGLQEKSNSIDLAGYALDNQTVAHFIVALEKSPYFVPNQVKLNQTKQEEITLRGESLILTVFSLSAQVTDLLKLKLAKESQNIEKS